MDLFPGSPEKHWIVDAGLGGNSYPLCRSSGYPPFSNLGWTSHLDHDRNPGGCRELFPALGFRIFCPPEPPHFFCHLCKRCIDCLPDGAGARNSNSVVLHWAVADKQCVRSSAGDTVLQLKNTASLLIMLFTPVRGMGHATGEAWQS